MTDKPCRARAANLLVVGPSPVICPGSFIIRARQLSRYKLSRLRQRARGSAGRLVGSRGYSHTLPALWPRPFCHGHLVAPLWGPLSCIPLLPASASIRSKAALGTRSRRPIRTTGSSPRLAASYALPRLILSFKAASGTVRTSGSLTISSLQHRLQPNNCIAAYYDRRGLPVNGSCTSTHVAVD